jgi:hypothetical protein
MEIRKKDYSRVLDFIIAELKEDGHSDMASHLETNPPKRTGKQGLLSVDLAQSVIDAKRHIGPSLAYLETWNLESIREYRNLRTMLENMEKRTHDGGWFNELKAMGGSGGAVLQPPKTIIDVETEPNPDDDDNKCQCDADTECKLTAIWKNPDSGVKCCGKHFQEVVSDLGGSHGFIPWDCEKDEYYKYVEDIGR